MKCHQFEDRMSEFFSELNPDRYIKRIRESSWKEDWSQFYSTDKEYNEMIRHVTNCNDCVDSLIRYLKIKDQVDYHLYPCFHLAYFSNSDTDKCIYASDGDFTIAIHNDKKAGIVIAFCPWCGAPLPTRYSEVTEAKEIGSGEWQEKQKSKPMFGKY